MTINQFLVASLAIVLPYIIDIFYPDAIKSALTVMAVTFCALGRLTNKLTWAKIVASMVFSLVISYAHKRQQRYWQRFRPDSPSETILPLYEPPPPPPGMYI
jgi:hypothetical protein